MIASWDILSSADDREDFVDRLQIISDAHRNILKDSSNQNRFNQYLGKIDLELASDFPIIDKLAE